MLKHTAINSNYKNFRIKSAHTTNYYDTFIEVADDCLISKAEVPVKKNGKETVASSQYEMISKHPYKLTSDDILFTVFAKRNSITKKDWKSAREKFFSIGQACLRSSPLTKRYGFGVHSESGGKVALYAIESAQYKKFLSDKSMKHLKAMRSVRVK